MRQGRSFVGLFGRVADEGIVMNLKLTDLDINGSVAGGVCAQNFGVLACCGVEGLVRGNVYIGGICGYAAGEIRKCYARASLEGSMSVGGIAGVSYCDVLKHCYFTGDLYGFDSVSGIANVWSIEVRECYTACDITAVEYDNCHPISCCFHNYIIDNCFYDPENLNGDLLSQLSSNDIFNRTDYSSTEMKDPATFINAGWDYSDTDGSEQIWAAVEGEYPVLAWELEKAVTISDYSGVPITLVLHLLSEFDNVSVKYQKSDQPVGTVISQYPSEGMYFTGSEVKLTVSAGLKDFDGAGTEQDPYKLDSIYDLVFVGLTPEIYDAHFVLTQDIGHAYFTNSIIAADHTPATPEFDGPAFTGTLDGNGHEIRYLNIDSVDGCNIGLFGSIGEDGKVFDLTLSDVFVTGYYGVGCLAGRSYGDISGCEAEGDVFGYDVIGGLFGGTGGGTVSMSSAECIVSGYYNTGGFCGINNGNIKDCWAVSAVTGCDMVYRSVYNYGYYSSNNIGGLVGKNRSDAIVENCYSGSEVNIVRYLENGIEEVRTGDVVDHHGGFCGNNEGNIAASFWNVDVSGEAESYGGLGLTGSSMEEALFYELAGWDFDHIWQSVEGGYPQLFFRMAGDLNGDRMVDIADFAILAEQWLIGYGLADMQNLAQNWLSGK